MDSNYVKVKQICSDIRRDYRAMVFAYIFDIGFQNAKEISDKNIDKCKDNGMLTKEFQQYLMRQARELTNACDSAVTLVQYCMAEDVYDIRNSANKLPRDILEEMVKTRISWEDVVNKNNADYIQYLTSRYYCDAEDLELLGIEIPDEYWNE